jgi:flagellar protein FliO/FliZ
VDSLFLVLRVAVSLAAVLGLLWYLQRRFAGRLGAHQRAGVSVLSRTPLGVKSQAVVLEAHGRRSLLGVTEHGVSVLDDDLPPAPEAASTTGPTAAPEEVRTPVALPWLPELQQKRGRRAL